MNETNKNRSETIEIFIFFLIAFGVNFLFGMPLMKKQYTTDAFGVFIMLLPANGVFLAKWYSKKLEEENKFIHYVMFCLFLASLVLMICNISNVLDYKKSDELIKSIIIIGSIILTIYSIVTKKGKRIWEGAGLVDKEIFGFICLLVIRDIISCIPEFGSGKVNLAGLPVMILFAPLSFVLQVATNFGEEYGWRGYLQEKLQGKFGKRTGVVVLGIVWAFWHVPYYCSLANCNEIEEWIWACVIIISISIFLGFVYMKTQNVWICVFLHFIYNLMNFGMRTGQTKQGDLFEKTAELLVVVVLTLYIFKKEYKNNN